MFAIASAGMPALWYLTRGSGAVALILLTGAVVLGVVDQQRWHSERWPRFALHTLHRWLSLFALAFLSVHILTAAFDSFAPIRLLDAVIPFAGRYRPLWLGFGALALDMLLAVTITSLLKKRVGQRTWRAVHWLSYAAWPVALVHGLGTGSDVRAGWLLAIALACVAAVWLAVFIRLGATRAQRRMAGLAALAAVPVALAIWLPQGPLARGWAKRAGTPARLLFASDVRPSPAAEALSLPFSAYLSGSTSERQGDDGLDTVELSMRFTGGSSGVADVALDGTPLAGGGLSVQSSRVTFGPASAPREYSGTVSSLSGTDLVADLSDASGRAIRVEFRIALEGSAVRGTMSAVNA